MISQKTTIRILIGTNLCLLLALFLALSSKKEAAPAPEPPARKPERPDAQTPVRQSESAVITALSTPRRGAPGNRLSALDRHLALVQRSGYDSLRDLHSRLLGMERAGYETQIERKIVLYRIGEINGRRAVGWYFMGSTERAEFAYGPILEGWASASPDEALAWWAALPPGRQRESLLRPLMQGYLGAQNSSWRSLEARLTREEFDAALLPLTEAAVKESTPGELIDLLEDDLADESPVRRNKVAVRINEALCTSDDFDALTRWYGVASEDGWLLSADRQNLIVRRIGATGGPAALDWAAETDEDQVMRVALGWVKSEQQAAGTWLRKNTLATGADEVAFQLAIASVVADPGRARDWAQFVLDDHLAETIEGIIADYETD